MITTHSNTTKLVVGLVGVALALSLAFAVPSTAKAQTIEDLTAQINSLLVTIQALQAQLAVLSGGGGGGTTACSFTRDLTLEVSGSDVTCLQDYLTGTGHFTFSGGSTGYFGPITRSAVAAWQAANNVSPPAGYFGPISRAKYSSIAGTTGGDGTTLPPATGTGLSVGGAVQPAASLAPDSAARIPFTNFTVTAGSDGAVIMDSVLVRRTGLSANAVFSGIVLLDENGIQLGTSKTLNSLNEAKVGEAVTIPAGTTRRFTIAGNMASDNSTRDGQVASLTVVGINTSAIVSGTLPITGASHTINASLVIGSVTADRGVE
ncbi:peptidoglycan-binding protein, partial [Patescibacteria group bacterium]|nr:peptidoglycan-binding protein [Patescibacteria group bacterium]